MPQTPSKKLKGGSPYENLSEAQLHALIEQEHALELARAQEEACQGKRRKPTEVDANWTNDIVLACRARLASLEAATAATLVPAKVPTTPPIVPPAVAAATPAASGSANPLTIVSTPSTPPAAALTPSAPIAIGSTPSESPAGTVAAATAPALGPPITPPPAVTPAITPAAVPTDSTKQEESGPLKLFSDLPPEDKAVATQVQEVDDVTTQHPACRPGALTKEQLRILRAKHAEFDAWVDARAREWEVTPISIWVNMGMHDREKRATSFWNKFQSVFWHRIHNPSDGEKSAIVDDLDSDGLIPKSLLVQLQDRCSREYARLSKYEEDDVSPEEKEAIIKERKNICDAYDDLHDPNEVQYKEGNTQKLMRQARKEFTSRSLYYSTRGVGVAGWVVSLDPVDATASSANFMFAGSDATRKWFDGHAINMRKTMRDFETSVRYVELQEAKRRAAGMRHTYLAHCNSNDRRRKEISRMLKEMWSELMDRAAPHHLCWDEWPEDMLLAQSRTVGWPDGVPCPGREPYKGLERAQHNGVLWKALCRQDGLEVKIESWTAEELEAVRTIPAHEREEHDTWLNIFLVRSHSGESLMTVRDVIEDREQSENAKSKRKAKSEAATSGTEDEEVVEAGDDEMRDQKVSGVKTSKPKPKAQSQGCNSSEASDQSQYQRLEEERTR
ncbi:hypothetical protein M422DRAFT_268271 [Sphaerobolus stellatus SS14]|uniref:Uncharacterized protein n=1 Tax=Sphaerobolus stellatus (strain SS14) TaxID=990650 RepID=A0A0C9U787_SPHS4|nr:hypothetical protein M422DRAFT_268271 [Sphaerobolus stellatus SS14]